MRLMGHAHIETTLLYVQLAPQDVFDEYTRAVERITQKERKSSAMKTSPHSLEEALLARVRLLATTLSPRTVKHYRQTVRLFMAFLRQHYPEIRRANQLKRDPHMLGWLEHLWMQKVSFTQLPLRACSRAAHYSICAGSSILWPITVFHPGRGCYGARMFREPPRLSRVPSRQKTISN
jgi:hypothetical protein